MKRVWCLIAGHDFRSHQIEDDSGTYRECRRCGKVDDSFDPRGKGVITTFGWGG